MVGACRWAACTGCIRGAQGILGILLLLWAYQPDYHLLINAGSHPTTLYLKPRCSVRILRLQPLLYPIPFPAIANPMPRTCDLRVDSSEYLIKCGKLEPERL